jgi:hypothetical protein
MLPPPQLHHRIHQSHLVARQLQDNRFQGAANRTTKSMLSCMVRSCCFRMEEVRLAVRYRNGLRLGDPIRSWMDLGDHLLTDHLSHWLMDHANRWLTAKNHCQIRSSIRCQNRSANS